MGKTINYEDFCKEVDKGDLLVGDNAKWAKEIAWRTPEAPLPSRKENKDGSLTVSLTDRERVVMYCAIGIQIKELEMKQIQLGKKIEKNSDPKDIEQYDHNEENLREFHSIAKKFEREFFCE